TVNDLKTWNELSSNLILIGQTLTVDGLPHTSNEAVEVDNEIEEEVEEAAPAEQEKAATTTEEPKKQEGETYTMKATAYTAECDGCTGVTKTGIDLNEDRNAKVIAVDPNVIPLGTKVHVEGYGEAIAGDIGGAIKGNKIDIHVPTKDEAYQWGVRTVNVTLLD